jgi:hypothetical protein
MKKLLSGLLFGLGFFASSATPEPPRQEFFAIRVYQLSTARQEARVDSFLQLAFLPALHRQKITGIGVFKAIGNDTAAIRRIYVFIPLKTFDEYDALLTKLSADEEYHSAGRSCHDAPYDDPAYIRMETILLKAFPDMPQHATPWTGQPYSPDRVYELRSYEGPSEGFFANKVKMFNDGGEITLFDKLGFHAVFYASVLSGAHMPNLMYMTSFDNMDARNDHWKTFGADPTWKSLSSSPEYQHNVSHIDDIFLHAAPYSEL